MSYIIFKKRNSMELKKNLIGMSAFVAVALGLAACCASRPHLRVTTVVQGCAKTPPPERQAEEIPDELPENCPEGLVCYTEDEHAVLERGLLQWKDVETWASVVWIACKPKEAAGP